MMTVHTPEEVARLTEDRIRNLPVAGREIAPKGKPVCILCRRAVGPIGRLLYPGAPTCSATTCETCRATEVTASFETAYGRAIDLYTLRTFLRCIDGTAVFVDRTELVGRATELGLAFADLCHWQWAYASWRSVHRPDAEELGRAVLVPPRRLDEVVRIRLKGPWLAVDPSENLPEPIRSEVRKIREAGPTVEEIPF